LDFFNHLIVFQFVVSHIHSVDSSDIQIVWNDVFNKILLAATWRTT